MTSLFKSNWLHNYQNLRQSEEEKIKINVIKMANNSMQIFMRECEWMALCVVTLEQASLSSEAENNEQDIDLHESL